MQDTASHGTPKLDSDELRHTLSVHDVGAQLDTEGVPRSRRQIIRYCETAMLDAVKVPGPTGAQWFISPASVPKAIADLKQWDAQRVRQGAPQPDTSSSVDLNPAPRMDPDIASHGAPEPAMAEKETSHKGSETEPAMASYVALLERDNEFLREQVTKKDEQITDLSKRFGETQTLLGAMQRMLAPLLGQADPFHRPEKRDANEPTAA